MAEEILVFDTGPLRHFAINNWLGVLKAVVGRRRAMIPDMVVDELVRATGSHPEIQAALDAGWIEHHDLSSDDEVAAYIRFQEGLVSGDRNRGEAGVIALAHTIGGTAVIDDRAGRKTAERGGIPLTGTLGLLLAAIRADPPLLTVSLVSHLVDDLIAGQYRLKIPPGGFEAWAKEQGYL